MASPLSISGNIVSPVITAEHSKNNSLHITNHEVLTETKVPFFPEETPTDQRFAKAFREGFIDENRRLNTSYRKGSIPGHEFRTEFVYNIALSLRIQFNINGKIKTLKDYFNEQYKQSLKEGNPIEYHDYIGSTVFNYGGKTFLHPLFNNANLSPILDAQALQNFESKPNDLDVREITNYPLPPAKEVLVDAQKVAYSSNDIEAHKAVTCQFFGKEIKSNESRFDPNIVFIIEGGEYPGGRGKIRVEVGYGNFKQLCLTDRTAVRIRLRAQALYHNKIEFDLVSPPELFQKAYVDHALGITDVEDEKKATEGNYIAVITMTSEIIRNKKCYNLSLYQNWIANHAAHFEEKWGIWPSKFAEQVKNSISSHLNSISESRLIFFLQFESLLMNAAPQIRAKFSKGLVDSAWMNLMRTAPLPDSWIYCARNKGIPAEIMRYFILGGVGLNWSLWSSQSVGGDYRFDLSCLLDNQPQIQMTSSQGLVWMVSWNLSIPENLGDILAPYVLFEDELLGIIAGTCSIASEESSTIPLLRKYAHKLPKVSPQSIENVRKLLKSDNPLILFLALSFLLQMQSLGVEGLEEDIFFKTIPKLLACKRQELRALTLKLVSPLVLSISAAHLHPTILDLLKENFSFSQWLKILAATRNLNLMRIVKDQWKEIPSISTTINGNFILDLMVHFPIDGLECLNEYLEDGGNIEDELHATLKNRFKNLTLYPPFLLPHWILLFNICSKLSIELDISSIEFKDRILNSYSSLYRKLRKAKDQDNNALKAEIGLLGTHLLSICNASPWKSACEMTALILTSQVFAAMEADLHTQWKRYFLILGASLPTAPVADITLSTIYAFCIRWLNYVTAKNLQKEEASIVRKLIYFLLENSKKASLKVHQHRLLSLCTEHLLFAGDDEKNQLVLPLVDFINSEESIQFPLIPLLQKSLKLTSEFFKKLSMNAQLRLVGYLLEQETSEATNLLKPLLKQSHETLPHQEAWHSFSRAITLAARRFSDTELFHAHIEKAAYTLKTTLLLEMVEIEVIKNEPSAYHTLLDLCSKYNDLSVIQKNVLHTSLLRFFVNPTFAKKAAKWYLAAALSPPIASEIWFQCIEGLVKTSANHALLDTLSLSITSALQNKDTVIPTTTIAQASKLVLFLSKNFSWNFLNLIFPLLNATDRPLWQEQAQLHLKGLIALEKSVDAIALLNSSYFECSDSALIDLAFRKIFEDIEMIPNHLKQAIQKYRLQISSVLWEFIWLKVGVTAKPIIAKEVYREWSTLGMSLNGHILQAAILCNLDELLTYLEDDKTCLKLLLGVPNQNHLISLIFNYLIKKNCPEELILRWIGLLEECKVDESTLFNVYGKLIPRALKTSQQQVLEICIKYTSQQIKPYQALPKSSEIKKYIDPYLQEEWPLEAKGYVGEQLLLFLRLMLDGQHFSPQPKNNTLFWLIKADLGEENASNPLHVSRITALLDASLTYKTLPEKNLKPFLNILYKFGAESLTYRQWIPALEHLGTQKLNSSHENSRKETLQKALKAQLNINYFEQNTSVPLDYLVNNLRLFIKHSTLLFETEMIIAVSITLLGLLKFHNNTTKFETFFKAILPILDKVPDKEILPRTKLLFCEILLRPSFMEKGVIDCHIKSIEKAILKTIHDGVVNKSFSDALVILIEKMVFHIYTFGTSTAQEYKFSVISILKAFKAKGYSIDASTLEIFLFFLRDNSNERKTVQHFLPIFWKTYQHLKKNYPNLIDYSLVSLLFYLFDRPSTACKIDILRVTVSSLLSELTEKNNLPYQLYYNLSCALDNILKGQNLNLQNRLLFLDLYYKIFDMCRKCLNKQSYIITEGHYPLSQTCVAFLSSLKNGCMFSAIENCNTQSHNSMTMSQRYNNFLDVLSQSILILCKKCLALSKDPINEIKICKDMLLQLISMMDSHPYLGLNEPEMVNFLVEVSKEVFYTLDKELVNPFFRYYLFKIKNENLFHTYWRIIQLLPVEMLDSAYLALLTYERKPLSTLNRLFTVTSENIKTLSNRPIITTFNYAYLYICLCEIYTNRTLELEIDTPLIDLNHTLGEVFAFLTLHAEKVFSDISEATYKENKLNRCAYSLVNYFFNFLKAHAIDINHPSISPLFYSLTLQMLKMPQESPEFGLGCELVHFAKDAGFFKEPPDTAMIENRKWLYRVLSELQLYPGDNINAYEWALPYLLETLPQNTNHCVSLISFDHMLNNGHFADFDKYIALHSDLSPELLLNLYRHAALMACECQKVSYALKYLQILNEQSALDVSGVAAEIFQISRSQNTSLSVEKLTILLNVLRKNSKMLLGCVDDLLFQFHLQRKQVLPLLKDFVRKYITILDTSQNTAQLQKLLVVAGSYTIPLPTTSKAFKVIVECITHLLPGSETGNLQKYAMRHLSLQTDFWENCALVPSSSFISLLKLYSTSSYLLPTPCLEILKIFSTILNEDELNTFAIAVLTLFSRKLIPFDKHQSELFFIQNWLTHYDHHCLELNIALLEQTLDSQFYPQISNFIIRVIQHNAGLCKDSLKLDIKPVWGVKEQKSLTQLIHLHLYKLYKANLSAVDLILKIEDHSIVINHTLAAAVLFKMDDQVLNPLGIEYFEKTLIGKLSEEKITKKVIFFVLQTYISLPSVLIDKALTAIQKTFRENLINSVQESLLYAELITREFSLEKPNSVKLEFYQKHYLKIPSEQQPTLFIAAIQLTHALSEKKLVDEYVGKLEKLYENNKNSVKGNPTLKDIRKPNTLAKVYWNRNRRAAIQLAFLDATLKSIKTSPYRFVNVCYKHLHDIYLLFNHDPCIFPYALLYVLSCPELLADIDVYKIHIKKCKYYADLIVQHHLAEVPSITIIPTFVICRGTVQFLNNNPSKEILKSEIELIQGAVNTFWNLLSERTSWNQLVIQGNILYNFQNSIFKKHSDTFMSLYEVYLINFLKQLQESEVIVDEYFITFHNILTELNCNLKHKNNVSCIETLRKIMPLFHECYEAINLENLSLDEKEKLKRSILGVTLSCIEHGVFESEEGFIKLERYLRTCVKIAIQLLDLPYIRDDSDKLIVHLGKVTGYLSFNINQIPAWSSLPQSHEIQAKILIDWLQILFEKGGIYAQFSQKVINSSPYLIHILKQAPIDYRCLCTMFQIFNVQRKLSTTSEYLQLVTHSISIFEKVLYQKKFVTID